MEKENKGVALEYTGNAPRIIATARGKLLGKLLEIAEKHNIPIYKDPDLAEVLSALKVGIEIPEGLYAAVSEVLAYCYRVNEKFKGKIRGLGFHNV